MIKKIAKEFLCEISILTAEVGIPHIRFCTACGHTILPETSSTVLGIIKLQEVK